MPNILIEEVIGKFFLGFVKSKLQIFKLALCDIITRQ